jgi:asparagine synthase (glutamine-hydrolysing)
MCGIVGIISSQESFVHRNELVKMTNIIVHRGPDGDGHWVNPSGQVGFGHRRLSILDLSNHGSQPMTYLDRYTITFNGEIYNYLEIRESLLKKGYQFKSSSDTEVLLALYNEEKENCLSFLDGMFAFAIWDEVAKTVFFARDRFGEKPFHYAFKQGKYFVFGSEMKSLWEYGIPRKANNTMLYRYLVNNELMNGEDMSETFYEGIFRLKAAHYGILYLPDLRLEIKRYWDIATNNINEQITEEQAAEQLRSLLFTSVNRRMRSDVPVGSSLSGGLDSSLIVCIMNNLNKEGNNKHTFSARFPGYVKDEGKYMQMVIDRTNVTPHFTYPDETQLLHSLDKIVWHQEEPFGSASIFAQYEVMRLAKENKVTVLLDGQGADEILGGYHHYYHTYFLELKKYNRSAYQEQLRQYRLLHQDNNINAITYQPGIKSFMKQMLPLSLFRLMKKQALHIQQQKNQFVNNEFYNSYRSLASSNEARPDKLNNILYNSVTGAGLQELLRYADRNSMAHSREVRLPFLSHELVDFLFTLPPLFKIQNGWTKYLMRKTFDDLLPNEITWRKDKIGYEPPQQKWMADNHLSEKIQNQKSKLIQEKILAPTVKDKQLDAAKNWKILMLGSYFDNK